MTIGGWTGRWIGVVLLVVLDGIGISNVPLELLVGPRVVGNTATNGAFVGALVRKLGGYVEFNSVTFETGALIRGEWVGSFVVDIGRTAMLVGTLVGFVVDDDVALAIGALVLGNVPFQNIGTLMGARDGILVGRRGVDVVGNGVAIGGSVSGTLVGSLVRGCVGTLLCGTKFGDKVAGNGSIGEVTFDGVVVVGAFIFTKITSIPLMSGFPIFRTKSIVMVLSLIIMGVGIDTTNGTFFPGAVRRTSKSFNTNISSSTHTSKIRSPI
jgi:hypothetical protein